MSFINTLIEYLQGIPPELATMILSVMPIVELRGALPVALLVYKLPIASAFFWSLIGNIIPVYFLLVFFERFSNWIRPRSKTADRFLTWLFERTRRKLNGQIEKYGYWALAIFVAIPLPATGAWTGALAAFVFGLPKQKSFWAIAAGTAVAALFVTAITLSANATIRALIL